jgi:recombination protein RecA
VRAISHQLAASNPGPHAPPADRLELVEELVRRLEARFGPGIIYRLSRARPKLGAVALSTGSLGLDRASGVGGVPRGRLSVLQGGDSSGKTTLAYHLLAEAQRDGGLAALIDGEGASDPLAMRACGVDLDDLILASPRDAAEALEMVEILVRCRALDAVVASALPPARPGLLALGLRKLNAWLKDAPTAVVFVDGGWGLRVRGWRLIPYPQSPSPNPLAFFASLIVELRQLRPVYGPGGDLLGLRVRAVVVKNRLAPSGGLAEFEVLNGRGLRKAAEALELALALGLVERRFQGLVWSSENVFLGRSHAAAQAELESDPELAAAIAAGVRGWGMGAGVGEQENGKDENLIP